MLTRRYFLGSVAALGSASRVAPANAADAPLAGKIFYKGEARYEPLRQAASWNARKPNRFPRAIVLAEGDSDVIAAVKLAKARSWQVSARSGGHSWTASHTRDNSVQINLAKMQEIEVDAKAMIARISPSVYGNVLNKKLREEHRLFTPSAHGVNVGMGGFVMCGGHGWNSRVMGLGCENLTALDVVTADGELIHASETENSDWLWAARGSGPGFFGVATRYYMKLHPLPPVMQTSGFSVSVDEIEPLIGWLRNSMANFPPQLEVILSALPSANSATITLAGQCIGDSELQVKSALSILDSCPAAAKATAKWRNVSAIYPRDVESSDEVQPTGARYAVDNIWTDAAAEQLMPHMRRLFTDYATTKSNIFWQCWGPVRQLPDMAYSVQADVYIAANGIYYDPADDARCASWCVEAMKRLDAVSAGAQMNDENTAGHPARYLSDSAATRLETLREKYDPQRRFPGYLKS